MLSLIGLLILLNSLAMLYSALCALTLCIKRVYGIRLQRKRLRQKHSLVEDINKIAIKIDNDEIFTPMTRRFQRNNSLKSLSNFESHTMKAAAATPGSNFVKVSATQTSFWKRIFYRKTPSSHELQKTPTSKPLFDTEKMLIKSLMGEDNEAGLIKIIASSSGGF